MNEIRIKFLFIPIFVFSSILVLQSPSYAKAQNFSCVVRDGVPSTIANMNNGKKITMIRWVSDSFSESGWSPLKRCQEVSERFTDFNNQGLLRYLTTGNINGMNVICVALSRGDRCSGLVYTLKSGQNPTETLKKLFGVQKFANSGPLNETGDRIYIDINEFLGVGSSDQLPQKSTGDKLNEW